MIDAKVETITQAAHAILKNEVKHLPLVPTVALKLIELTTNENVAFADLARIISTDPSLATKILRHVNSAAFGLAFKITSISHAVKFLGFSAVRQLAIDLLFYDQLIKSARKPKFDKLYFWQHCLFVALLSKKIAQKLQHSNPDLIYAAGLIHDIGKIIFESYGRLSYSDFLSTIHNTEYPVSENERRFFGISHEQLGQVFCMEWQLPEAITAVVACHHHDFAETAEFADYQTEIAIVAFANYIAWMQGISSVPSEGNPILYPVVLQRVDVQQLDLDSLLQAVDEDMQQTRAFYGIHFPNVHKLRAAMVKAAIQLSQWGEQAAARQRTTKKTSAGLTAPHQSLIPEEFVPGTLAAIVDEYQFDRCALLSIDPKRRSLTMAFCWPENLPVAMQALFTLDLQQLPHTLVYCLRAKEGVLLSMTHAADQAFLQRLHCREMLILPVLNQNRLMGLLCADNYRSQQLLLPAMLAEIFPIANELGIALHNAKQYELQKFNAQIDPLTKLFNKRMIEDFLRQMFDEPVALASMAVGFIDIDKFKLFNDLCGHQAGDDVLKIVADILRALTRPGDFVGRYGGEEFLFVLRNTDKQGAFSFAERIRTEVERRGQVMRERFHGYLLSVSIGVAVYQPEYKTPRDMIEVADQAMYNAKDQGRNKVIIH